MRVPFTHKSLIAPAHRVGPEIPSRGVVRVAPPQPVTEERPERSGAVAVSQPKRKPKAEAVEINEAALGEMVEHVGVFIKLPEWLGRQFPQKKEDTSPPHVTMLYVGKCSPADLLKLRDAVREVCRNCEPFTLDVSDYGEFDTLPHTGTKRIAHMVPRVLTGEKQLAEIHEKLWSACEKAGITCDHYRDGPFKPHITLKYMNPGSTYKGPRPQGRFAVRYLDLWAGDDHQRVPLGNDAKGGPEVPKAELVQDSLSESRFIGKVLHKLDLRALASVMRHGLQVDAGDGRMAIVSRAQARDRASGTVRDGRWRVTEFRNGKPEGHWLERTPYAAIKSLAGIASYALGTVALLEEKDACYRKVKAQYKVFPSAYASGAIAKCRKAKGQQRKESQSDRKQAVGESLRRWFREKWVDTATGKPCGAKTGAKTKYCRPSKRVSKDTPKTKGEMSKGELRSKRREKRKVGMGDEVSDAKRGRRKKRS